MATKDTEFRQLLRAMMDARCVVLSVMNQLGLHSFKERELAEIVRKAAMDLVSGKPSIASAIKAGIKPRPSKRGKKPHYIR